MIRSLIEVYNRFNGNYQRTTRIFRYLISGTFATATNLFFLFILTDFIGIYYVLSAVISYLISFFVSFVMQKYWTFSNYSHRKINFQATIYIIVTTANMGLNALGIYILVQYLGMYYLFAQVIISMMIAIESFFIYQAIFKDAKNEAVNNHSKN